MIWHAVKEAYTRNGREEGVPLPLIFIILPLSFHQKTATAFASKTRPGAIYKALADDREITIGLQARMQAMSNRTFQSLSIGLSSGLLRLDQGPQCQIIPGKRIKLVGHVTEKVKIITKAAKRIGQSFSELTPVQIATHLGIRF